MMNDKFCLVTGGNSGIGLAAAKVAILGRDAATLDQAATTIGRGTLAVKGDVSNLADLDRMYAEIGRAGSKLDGVFVNAGIAQFPSIADVTEAWFDRIVAINLKGAYSYCVIKNRVL